MTTMAAGGHLLRHFLFARNAGGGLMGKTGKGEAATAAAVAMGGVKEVGKAATPLLFPNGIAVMQAGRLLLLGAVIY